MAVFYTLSWITFVVLKKYKSIFFFVLQTVDCTSPSITASLLLRKWPPAVLRVVESPPLHPLDPLRPHLLPAQRRDSTVGQSLCSFLSHTPSPSVAGPRNCPISWSVAFCCGCHRTGCMPSACAKGECTGKVHWLNMQTSRTSWRKSRPVSWWTPNNFSQVNRYFLLYWVEWVWNE